MAKQSFNMQEALRYHGLGWSIIPFKERSKTPLTKKWKNYQKKQSTKKAIGKWWNKWPRANIGIITGAISRLVVLDADSVRAEIFVKDKGIPPTPQVRTGKGTHFYLKHPGGRIPNKVNGEIGLDIRGDGGYVVAPPSIHPSGKRYEWAPDSTPWNTKLAPLPAWVREHIGQVGLDSKRVNKNQPGWHLQALGGAERGSRNSTLTSLAGYYIAEGKGDEEVEAILLGANVKNVPPLSEKEVRQIVRSVRSTHERKNPDHEKPMVDGESGTGKDEQKQTHADILIEICLGPEVMLFHDQSRRPFAFVTENGTRSIWPVSSRSFQDWLAKRFFNRKGRAPSKDALRQSLPILSGKARFEGRKIRLHNRVAWHDGAIYYDLADEKGRLVKITPGSWEILGENDNEELPILFRRHEHQEAQPTPDANNSDIGLFLEYLNLSDVEQKLLFLIYIISCFIPGIPHPVSVIHGPQGAAKSTTTRLARRLVDPSVNDVQTLTKKIDQTIQVLSQNWFCVFDNISHIDGETSDALCRASTGGTLSKRQLYTDEDTIIFELQNCVSLNGINVVVTKADLMDRALLFEAARIPDDKRKEASAVLREFDKDRPGILAGIFKALSKAMEIRPGIEVDRLPRMADFARWGMAISEAIGRGASKFSEIYSANISQQHEEILDTDPVGLALRTFMADISQWTGLVSELLTELENLSSSLGIDQRSKGWPKAPHIFSRRLNRLETTLAGVGITIKTERSNRGKIISILKENALNGPEATPVSIENDYQHGRGVASVATSIPREDDKTKESSFSVEPKREEERIEHSVSLKPEQATQGTPATLLATLTLDSCSECEHLHRDGLWVGCKKAGMLLSMLKSCPLDGGFSALQQGPHEG